MPQLIAGNWKMHMLRTPAAELATAVRAGADGLACELLVCPPFTAIEPVARVLAGSAVAVGGQDCHTAQQGAHTGDISPAMLRDAGATWVILGHSERRQNHAETDELVREKVLAAVDAGLTPIVCVGETEEQRISGQETEVVGWQIAGSLPKPFVGAVAYEPVWAIGTGKTATEQDVAAMHAFIREELVRQFGDAGQGIRILYGGSMRPANAASLLAVPHVGGGLIGGASLKADDFLAIARAAREGYNAPPRGSSMTTVLLIIHLFVTLALIGVVLIQRSEGGGLGIGSSQGMGAFMSGRGTANLLTRMTAILATVFMVLSLTLALMNRGTTGVGGSLLDAPASASGPAPGATLPAAPAPAPAAPTGPAVPTN